MTGKHWGRAMIQDSAPLTWFISNYYAVGGSGQPRTWYMGRQVYKGSPDREVIKVVTPDVSRRVPDKTFSGASNVIELGGVFEEIGGADEAIGGGNQKMGTDN